MLRRVRRCSAVETTSAPSSRRRRVCLCSTPSQTPAAATRIDSAIAESIGTLEQDVVAAMRRGHRSAQTCEAFSAGPRRALREIHDSISELRAATADRHSHSMALATATQQVSDSAEQSATP